MSDSVIAVENISKFYQIGEFNSGSLRNDIQQWLHRKNRRFSGLQTEKNNLLESHKTSNKIWSLKNVSFNVNRGDIVGIIGSNGAGKSTLLKILSRVTSPSSGKILGKGKVASLLEVGTGFHPDLTGRENIFLNGAILGMNNKDIKRNLDEIISFSGVENYIDTPVKRYSSGMYVRLAFAVAAHLNTEILIVDEVLSVGDAQFQKKCMGKISELSKGDGKTILFVSHNLNSIRTLCNRSLLLDKGSLLFDGSVNETINKYTEGFLTENETKLFLAFKSAEKKHINIEQIKVNDSINNPVKLFGGNNVIEIEISGEVFSETNISFEFKLFDKDLMPLLFYSPAHFEGISEKVVPGKFHFCKKIELPKQINKGNFVGSLYLTDPGFEYHVKFEHSMNIMIDGYPTKTGHVFEYKNGAGFLFSH